MAKALAVIYAKHHYFLDSILKTKHLAAHKARQFTKIVFFLQTKYFLKKMFIQDVILRTV